MSKPFLLCLCMMAVITGSGQQGSLDSAFGFGKGWLTTNIPTKNTYDEYGRQVLLQQDGSLLVLFNANGACVLTRYKKDGSKDVNYGIAGYSQVVPILLPSAVQQPDGKIIVAGYAQDLITTSLDFALARYHPNGTLDSTFDGDGMLTTDFLGHTDQARAIALQPDGKIVVAGGAIDPLTTNYDFALARYHSNGMLDVSFDSDGKLTTDFTDGYDMIYSLAVQQDGKIVVAGETVNNILGSTDFGLARYHADGTPDNSFDNDGRLTTDFAGANDMAFSMAVQSDGKLIAAGTTSNFDPFDRDFVLARYNVDGTLDNTFDGDGILIADFGGLEDAASVVLQPDGKIVLTGNTGFPSSSSASIALARFHPDGTPDNSFDDDGQLIADISGEAETVAAIVLQKDGRILITGDVSNATFDRDFYLVQYLENGLPDRTFGEDGQLQGAYPYGDNTTFKKVALQPDGKIIVAGEVIPLTNEHSKICLARYKTDGTLDSLFGNGGILTPDLSIDEAVNALAVQADGKILIAGATGDFVNPTSESSVIRYNKDGSPDSSFGNGGHLRIKTIADNGGAYAIAVQEDGKIVVAVWENDFSNPDTEDQNDFVLYRFSSTGNPDLSFGSEGKVKTNFFGGIDVARSIVIQPDKKIVVAGTAVDPHTSISSFAVARYNTDGTPDNSFGTNGKLTTAFFNSDHAVSTVLLQQDGKILVGGSVINTSTNSWDFALARYHTNGSLDTSFDRDGLTTTDILGGFDQLASVVLQPNGKIIAAGSAVYPAYFKREIALARYNSNGLLDSTFGDDGKATTNILGNSDQALASALSNNGRLYVAGAASNGVFEEGLLAAFNLEVQSLVSSFTLVDALADKDLQPLADGTVIDLKKIRGKSINIRANTSTGAVGSVVMELKGRKQRNHIENIKPYALFGNTQDDYKSWQPAAGNYILTATPYSGPQGTGTAGTPLTVRFTIADEPVLTHFTLVNAATNKDLDTLRDGAVIDLALTPEINIRANRETETVESVRFGVNSNAAYGLQNSIPFALASDNKGDYLSWKVEPGTYTITATPYTRNNASGAAGTPLQITIKVIRSEEVMVPSGITSNKTGKVTTTGALLNGYPNPFNESVRIQFGIPQTGYVNVTLVNAVGRMIKNVYSGRVEANVIYTQSIRTESLSPGVYFCRMTTAKGSMIISKLVKYQSR